MATHERNRIKKPVILQGFFSQQFLDEFLDDSIFLPVFEISPELARFSGIENPVLPGFSRCEHHSYSDNSFKQKRITVMTV